MENLSKKHEVKEVEVEQDDSKRWSKKDFHQDSEIIQKEIKRKKMKTQTKNKQTAGSNMKYKEKKNASWEIVTKGKKELSSESPRGQHREGHLLCPCPDRPV